MLHTITDELEVNDEMLTEVCIECLYIFEVTVITVVLKPMVEMVDADELEVETVVLEVKLELDELEVMVLIDELYE